MCVGRACSWSSRGSRYSGVWERVYRRKVVGM